MIEANVMIEIRYVKTEDKEFWYSLDRYLPEREFDNKVSSKRGYGMLLTSTQVDDDALTLTLVDTGTQWDRHLPNGRCLFLWNKC